MRKTLLAAVLAASLPAGGCAELGARAIARGAQIEQAAADYAGDVHDTRRQIREKCWEILTRQVDGLIAEEHYDQARALLGANYPGLVSIRAVKDALDKDVEAFGEPIGCEVLAAPLDTTQ